MKTVSAKKQDVMKKWLVIDASGQILGRLASKVASLLRGKHKPIFTPHVDTGDHVIVINAEKVRLTGRKQALKVYHHHTGYPGGLRSITAGSLLKEAPERLIHRAVQGMLPKTTLGHAMLKKLKVYRGPEHPHQSQQPAVNKVATTG
jgi:large subunit ribosomal protein L13